MDAEGRPVESFYDKIVRKTKKDPLVPVGIGVTLVFLSLGFRSFLNGRKREAQLMMRGRVLAQAFTVAAMGVSAFYGFKPHDRPANVEEQLTLSEQNRNDYYQAYQKKPSPEK
jgi:hypothetical protein